MSADRYNRLVAYLNSPERVTLWEHRRLSQPYLWGRDESREPVRSITGLAVRLQSLFGVGASGSTWDLVKRPPMPSDALKITSMIRIARGLSSAPGWAPLADAVQTFFNDWAWGRSWHNTVDTVVYRYALRAVEVKRFPTKGAFYAELWHRLKSHFAFADAPKCEFEGLPGRISALIRPRNFDADSTNTLRLAINRNAGDGHGPLTIGTTTDDRTVYIGPPEGWLETSFAHEHIEEHGFEVE